MSKASNSEPISDSGPELPFFCGFDWARSHKVMDEGCFQNTTDGFHNFFERLDTHRDGQKIALIIESNRTSALTLLGMKEWITLYPVNPAVTRKLIEGSGKGKSDPRDSYLVCGYAIKNLHKLRIEDERDPDILCLRELVDMSPKFALAC